MGALFAVLIAMSIGYLFNISKQRRNEGKPPLPIIGTLMEPLLDAHETISSDKSPEDESRRNIKDDERIVSSNSDDVKFRYERTEGVITIPGMFFIVII